MSAEECAAKGEGGVDDDDAAANRKCHANVDGPCAVHGKCTSIE